MDRTNENILMICLHLLTIILIIISFALIKNYITTKDQLIELNVKLEQFIEVQQEHNKITGDMLVNTNYYLGQMIAEKEMHEETAAKIPIEVEQPIETTLPKKTEDTIIEGTVEQEEGLLQTIVSIYASDNIGSGFVISAYGHILTSYEVVQDYKKIEVDFYDGTIALAKPIKTFKDKNLAIIRVIGKRLPYLQLGNSANIEIGQQIKILHHPLGYSITENIGNITKLDFTHFEFTASTNKGSLGGPIINDEGKVIGIITRENNAMYSNDIIPLLKEII